MTFEELMDSTPPMQQHALVKGYQAGFAAGAASRDAEVASLTNQRDYEYVRAENAEQERDQLREKVEMLRDALGVMEHDSEECLDFDECTAMLVPMDNWHTLFEALAKVRKP